MNKGEQLYEGKAKKVFATEDPELLIVSYKDDATAFNGLKKGTIRGKGVINNKMSNALMRMLEGKGIPTHFVEEINDRETVVKKVQIVPLEVIIRNISAGSFAKHYGVEEGIVFDAPTIEFSYKNDELGDPLLNEYHALALKLATKEEIETIKDLSFRGRHHRAGGRDQPGYLPPVGQQDPREAGQGPFPQGPGRRRGSLPGDHGTAGKAAVSTHCSSDVFRRKSA